MPNEERRWKISLGRTGYLSIAETQSEVLCGEGCWEEGLEKLGRRQHVEDHPAAELVLQGVERSIKRSKNGGRCIWFYHLDVEAPVRE